LKKVLIVCDLVILNQEICRENIEQSSIIKALISIKISALIIEGQTDEDPISMN